MAAAAGDWDEYDDQEPDDDWYDDDRDDYEPDPEDGDIARAYEEHYEHLDAVHGGGECDCRPSLAARVSQALHGAGYWAASRTWWPVKRATRPPWTFRAGPVEITLRLRADRRCGACGGRGWNYSLTPKPEHPMPPGYNGTALCGCGSAIGKLAETRRKMRQYSDEPPF